MNVEHKETYLELRRYKDSDPAFSGNWGEWGAFAKAAHAVVACEAVPVPRRDSTWSGRVRFRLAFNRDFSDCDLPVSSEVYETTQPTWHWEIDYGYVAPDSTGKELTSKQRKHIVALASAELPPVPSAEDIRDLAQAHITDRKEAFLDDQRRELEIFDTWADRVSDRAGVIPEGFETLTSLKSP